MPNRFRLRNPFHKRWVGYLQKTAEKNFEIWSRALHDGELERLANFYESAHFFPTMSGDYRFGVDGARNYFKGLVAKKVKVEVIEGSVCPVGIGHYIHLGKYHFKWINGNTEEEIVEAFFSYTWLRRWRFWGEWTLILHHSSIPFKNGT